MCLRVFLLFMLVFSWTGTAKADYATSRQWFTSLTADERMLLQSQLILVGEYSALVDGDFGPATYAALTAVQEELGLSPTDVLSAQSSEVLAGRAAEMFSLLGLEIVDDARGQFSMVVPTGLLTNREPTRRGTAYFDPDNLVRLETINKPYAEESYPSLYRTLISESATRSVTYETFNSERFVVSGVRAGLPFYIYMHATPTASVGFSMEWHPDYQSLAGTIAVFTASHSYPSVFSPSPPTAGTPIPDNVPGQVPSIGYGTAFFVAANGVLVTNHHVIVGCSAITIPGYGPAAVITSDRRLDLSVLQLASPRHHAVATIRSSPVQLGEDVTMAGYPLPTDMASSLSVGNGIISSLSGLDGNAEHFTTNVGVQPGNSGGPILDEYGQVVGVAVSKLDDMYLLASRGTIAPNFGFAIKNEALMDYLSIFKLADSQPSPKALSVRQTAEAAQDFTVQVVCSPE